MNTRRIAALTVCVVTALLGGACGDDDAVTGTTYAACADAADCTVAGDTCIAVPMATLEAPQESQCTRECTSDAECSGSGRCLSAAGGPRVCHHRCISHADCRNGWGCQLQDEGFSICLPGPSTEYGIPALQACPLSTVPGACRAELECFGIDPSGPAVGICTRTCSEARPCDRELDGSSCITFNEIDFTCLQTCTVGSAECPEGLTCKDRFDDGTEITPVCLPITPPADGGFPAP